MRVCSSTSPEDSVAPFALLSDRLRAQGYAEATIRSDVKWLRRVARWLAGRGHGFLRMSSLVGQPVSALTVQSAMSRAYRRAGLPRTWHGSHRLRHTFASRLFASGASLKEIADVLGHRRLDSANRYTGVDLISLRKVALCRADACSPDSIEDIGAT